MPASTTDIQAGTRAAKIETWSDSTIHTRYPSARDGATTPSEGFFDAAADADTAIAQRAALFGVERRHFSVVADDLLWPDPATAVPIIQLIDGENAVNGKTIPARIELDCGAETTTYEVFG